MPTREALQSGLKVQPVSHLHLHRKQSWLGVQFGVGHAARCGSTPRRAVRTWLANRESAFPPIGRPRRNGQYTGYVVQTFRMSLVELAWRQPLKLFGGELWASEADGKAPRGAENHP